VIDNKTYPADFQNETTLNCTAPSRSQPGNVTFDLILIYPYIKSNNSSMVITYYGSFVSFQTEFLNFPLFEVDPF
jgi:hypothetical protein